MRNIKGMHSDGQGSGEGTEGKKTVIKIYLLRKNFILNKSKKEN